MTDIHEIEVATADESEGVLSDSEQDYPNRNTTPQSLEEFERWQAHIGLQKFGEGLNAAAKAISPADDRPPYSKVYVLMLSWGEADSHSAAAEVSSLSRVFKDAYNFDIDVWTIPIQGSKAATHQKILQFIGLGDDSAEDLKILYYAGQTRLIKNKELALTCCRKTQDSKYPIVQWNSIQKSLENAQSDVLILLDCPYMGTAGNQGNGVTELIAASAYGSAANGLKRYSFTKELKAELRVLATATPSATVGILYENLFILAQARIAAEGKEDSKRVCLQLTQEDPSHPRSIRLAAYRDSIVEDSEDSALHPTSEIFDAVEQAFDNSIDLPRIALAIRLKEYFKVGDLSPDLFLEWVRRFPDSADLVKIEAGFHSYSSLLIVSVPVGIFLYMPKDPAIISLGPINKFGQDLNLLPNTMRKILPIRGRKNHPKQSTNGI